eukprot:jgi/Chlat1/1496/Chrsp12S02040
MADPLTYLWLALVEAVLLVPASLLLDKPSSKRPLFVLACLTWIFGFSIVAINVFSHGHHESHHSHKVEEGETKSDKAAVQQAGPVRMEQPFKAAQVQEAAHQSALVEKLEDMPPPVLAKVEVHPMEEKVVTATGEERPRTPRQSDPEVNLPPISTEHIRVRTPLQPDVLDRYQPFETQSALPNVAL